MVLRPTPTAGNRVIGALGRPTAAGPPRVCLPTASSRADADRLFLLGDDTDGRRLDPHSNAHAWGRSLPLPLAVTSIGRAGLAGPGSHPRRPDIFSMLLMRPANGCMPAGATAAGGRRADNGPSRDRSRFIGAQAARPRRRFALGRNMVGHAFTTWWGATAGSGVPQPLPDGTPPDPTPWWRPAGSPWMSRADSSVRRLATRTADDPTSTPRERYLRQVHLRRCLSGCTTPTSRCLEVEHGARLHAGEGDW